MRESCFSMFRRLLNNIACFFYNQHFHMLQKAEVSQLSKGGKQKTGIFYIKD